VRRNGRWAEYGELIVLFFIHAMGMGMWFVPLSRVLDAHGLQSIRPYAFATSAVAALVSPLFFGGIADRHISPVRVLRWLAFGTAIAMASATTSIQLGWNRWIVLAIIQLHALIAAPTWSISTTIVLGRLTNPTRQFGPVRVSATVGWMVGCWVVSLLHADASVRAGYGGALVWLVLASFTLALPSVPPAGTTVRLTLKERLGLDALTLLRDPDHRVVFITAALISIPIAAFFPYTPPHLESLGFQHTSAWMSLGQVTEILAQFGLAWLLTNFRLKWMFFFGLLFAFFRYLCFAVGTPVWLLAGISLHGLAFTLFYVTAPVYLNERVDHSWRARAQALMTLMTTGLGNLVGYLASGAWFNACRTSNGVQWRQFWGGLTAIVALVTIYFVTTYRGQRARRGGAGALSPAIGPADDSLSPSSQQ
jgi:nucleoside transporter